MARQVPSTAVAPVTPADAGDDFVVLLVRAAKLVVEELRAGRDPGDPEIGVVQGLAAHHLLGRTDVTTSALARHLGMTKQSAAEIVTGLEQAGLVRRAPHPHDGRARVLLLTPQGRARLRRRRHRWDAVEADWADVVGPATLATVRGALQTYLDARGVTTGAE